MNCPICQKEFPNKPKCDQHVSRDHKITLSELKTSKFMELSEDGLSGLTILENGKAICSVCAIAFTAISSGKRHFMKKHCTSDGFMKYEVKNDGTILNDHSEQENSEKCIKNEVYDDDNVFNEPPRQVNPEELVANPESVSKVDQTDSV